MGGNTQALVSEIDSGAGNGLADSGLTRTGRSSQTQIEMAAAESSVTTCSVTRSAAGGMVPCRKCQDSGTAATVAKKPASDRADCSAISCPSAVMTPTASGTVLPSSRAKIRKRALNAQSVGAETRYRFRVPGLNREPVT